MAVGCFLLGLAFNDCDPCQRVLFFFACVFLLFLVLQIVVAIITKIKDKQADISDWRNEDSIGESVTTLKRESQDKTEDKSEVRKSFVTKEKLEEYLKAEKDERIKPFIENCINCYDILCDTARFEHNYDRDNPDSEESQLHSKAWGEFYDRIKAAQIKLGDENSASAESYKRLGELFDEDCDGEWIIYSTISEYSGNKSFKNAPSFDRDLLFKYSDNHGCNYVDSYCDIPFIDIDSDVKKRCFFYPDFVLLCKDYNDDIPNIGLEVLSYDELEINTLKIKIKSSFIWDNDIHDAKKIGTYEDDYGNSRPIYEYSGIEIPALNCTLVFSKASYAKELAEAMNDFFSAPHGKGATSAKRPSFSDLDGLIGLDSVKEEVKTLRNYILIQQEREKQGLKSTPVSYHCVFTGNPGTGKTTVARIVADVYRSLGVLKKGHLVETDRSGLVADYVGQTATKTNKIIDRALDGVLFIDEAYSLANGGDNDYGKEAIATLLKRMEDNRDRLVVILAGYSSEMKQFIDSNPGLQSRFNRYIHFPDYNADELFQIFEVNCQKHDYVMTDGAKSMLKLLLEKAVAEKDQNFGNARFVRNLFEKTVERQANRLSKQGFYSKDTLTEITAEDLYDNKA